MRKGFMVLSRRDESPPPPSPQAAMVVYMDIASLLLQVLQLVQAAQDAS